MHMTGNINNVAKLATIPQPTKPQTVTSIPLETRTPLYAGSCPHCAPSASLKSTVASFLALPKTFATGLESSAAPEHRLHTKEQHANGLQQRLSNKFLQQLNNEIQHQIQQQVQKIQQQVQPISTSTFQKARCGQTGETQSLLPPPDRAPQGVKNNTHDLHAVTELSPQQYVGSRWSHHTPGIEMASPVLSAGTLRRTPTTNRLKRSCSGPINGMFQPWDTLAPPNTISDTCAQRMQWLQSWSAEAQGSKEKQLLATLKELNARPDFALVDVWRVFDPEGAGISEARGVQDGFSRLGIRCSSQEAHCFIWYYCPPHPLGLTFPIFASLFAAGGDEQLPLLRCIQQQNPSTVPAAYLALSSTTRKLLATFLRLALDKAISRWVSRSFKQSGLSATPTVSGNLMVC